MSTNSNDRGRAYEYAWINVLQEKIDQLGSASIVKNSSLEANRRAWQSMDTEMQNVLIESARSAVDCIVELEPLVEDSAKDTVLLEFQQDGAGISGDVRDIVLKRSGINWEVGLSIKHNHDAVKHSRLSHRLDFGAEWFGVPCSEQYWADVKPLFDFLKEEKAKKTKWPEIGDKDKVVYIPLLQAFMDEVNRAYQKDPDIPRKMVEYLIGVNDYYKIVSRDAKRLTTVGTFNLHGTLNKPDKTRVSEIVVPVLELPTELVSLRFKSGSSNTVEMYLNNGWQLSFRIHNASSKVEPSLKFDVQFMGMPPAVLTLEGKWSE